MRGPQSGEARLAPACSNALTRTYEHGVPVAVRRNACCTWYSLGVDDDHLVRGPMVMTYRAAVISGEAPQAALIWSSRPDRLGGASRSGGRVVVLIGIAKTALLIFLIGSVLYILGTYYLRRRAGVVPWRPPNSRILGYDAPPAVIAEQPPSPSHTVGEPEVVQARQPHRVPPEA